MLNPGNRRPHGGRKRTGDRRKGDPRSVRDGGIVAGGAAGGGHDDRSRRPFRAEGAGRRLHPPHPVHGLRNPDATPSSDRRGRPGRLRAANLGHGDRRRRGRDAADPARGRPLRGRRSQLARSGGQGRHRDAQDGTGGLDRRREDLDQRTGRLEGLRERARAEDGAGAAARLPAHAAGRGYP